MNHLRGMHTIWYRDILRFWADRMRMVSAIVFPLFFLFIFGSGLGSRLGMLGPGVNFSQFMFPGVIGMTVFMGSFMGGVSVVWDREFGFLKEVLVAPVSRTAVALGKTLGTATIAIIQGVLTLIFAPLIGVSLSALTVLALLPLMFLLAITMGAFGVLLATRIKSMQAFQVIVQMLMFPMMFLSGVFFPVEGLPAWMNFLVKINPATYGIAPIREVMLGEAGQAFNISLFGHVLSLSDNVAIVTGFAVVMIILAVLSFRHQ